METNQPEPEHFSPYVLKERTANRIKMELLKLNKCHSSKKLSNLLLGLSRTRIDNELTQLLTSRYGDNNEVSIKAFKHFKKQRRKSFMNDYENDYYFEVKQ